MMNNYAIPQIIREQLLIPNSSTPVRKIVSGLSEASIWQCSSPRGERCLRAWPISHPTPQRLTAIHRSIQQLNTAKLTYIPTLYSNIHGKSFTLEGQQLWELTSWQPGIADYLTRPSDAKLRLAMQALAEIHYVWSKESTTGSSPTVADRLQRLQFLLSCHPERFLHPCRDAVEQELVHMALSELLSSGPQLKQELTQLISHDVNLHFAIRDIWSDHVLFQVLPNGQPELTGIIDFGAARVDEPLTDVVRLVTSLEPNRMEHREKAIAYYCESRGIRDFPWKRFRILDQAASLLGAFLWIQWLVIDRKQFAGEINQYYARCQQLIIRSRTAAAQW